LRHLSRPRAFLIVAAVTLTAACSDDGKSLREPGTGGATPRPIPTTTVPVDIFSDAIAGDFVVRSPAVRPGDLLPRRHTAGGADVAPEIQWRNPPADAVEIAIVMTDITDGFVHWVVAGIDPVSGTVFEALIPPGAVETINDFGQSGYGGPAPPVGSDAHSYVFKVLALGEFSGITPDQLGRDVIAELEGIAIGVAELFTFYRQASVGNS